MSTHPTEPDVLRYDDCPTFYGINAITKAWTVVLVDLALDLGHIVWSKVLEEYHFYPIIHIPSVLERNKSQIQEFCDEETRKVNAFPARKSRLPKE